MLPLQLRKGKTQTPEFYEPICAFLEMKWSVWEEKGTKYFARAAEVVEAGLFEKMSETTFREICEEQGFLEVDRAS